MIEVALMDPSKETDNKLRQESNVDGVGFELYIPKWRVPRSWPVRIIVSIRNLFTDEGWTPSRPSIDVGQGDAAMERPIVAIVDKVKEHTKTVRFAPRGKREEWEIGEPYIPCSLLSDLSDPPPETIQIVVRWDRSTGTWS